MPINPGYILYHDNEKIVIRNYEGKIFEYPETGNENVQFAPQREYHDEYLVLVIRFCHCGQTIEARHLRVHSNRNES